MLVCNYASILCWLETVYVIRNACTHLTPKSTPFGVLAGYVIVIMTYKADILATKVWS